METPSIKTTPANVDGTFDVPPTIEETVKRNQPVRSTTAR